MFLNTYKTEFYNVIMIFFVKYFYQTNIGKNIMHCTGLDAAKTGSEKLVYKTNKIIETGEMIENKITEKTVKP